MTNGLDYSAGTIPGSVIRGAGYNFVVRYVGTPGRTKNITKAEFDDLVAHGVVVWLVYENSTTDALGGFGAGQAAARAARADADSIGYPAGGTIFFACDMHLMASQIPAALAYLDGAADVIGRAAVGCYGFTELISAAKSGRHATYFWQCGVNPGNASGVHIWQDNTTSTHVGGVACDINRLLNPMPPLGGAPAVPGGIEEMAFNDSYTDWANNPQTVLSWMNHLDQRLAELHSLFLDPGVLQSRIPGDKNTTNLRDMIMDAGDWTNQILGHTAATHDEITKPYQSEVPGSTYSAPMGQMATNADAYGYGLTQKVADLETKLDAIIAALNAAQIAPKSA